VRMVVQSYFLLFSLIIVLGTAKTDGGLKCYSEATGDATGRCEERRGYRTCFIKYDSTGKVTGRGCATKDKIFRTECENHAMAGKQERFCYCSYYLCNGSDAQMMSTNFYLIITNLSLLLIGQTMFSLVSIG